MSKSVAVVILVALSALAFIAVRQSQAAEDEKAESLFGDKVALVYLKGRIADFAFTLQDVTLINFHGKKMLAAVHADTGPEEQWLKGRKAFIAWSSVESIVLFDSVKDYKEAIERAADDTL